MRKTRTQKPARKFVALKARLAVEALLRFRKLPAIVKDASIHVCSATSQWTWYFKETETGDLEITLAMVLEEISESEMKANLMQAVHPVGTKLQILRATGAETSLALAKRVVRTAPDPMEIIDWSTACENAFLGQDAPEEDEECGEPPSVPPALDAVYRTNNALLDLLLEEMGGAVRVTASEGPGGMTAYGFPAGDAFFQFSVTKASDSTCGLDVGVFVGRLFSRHDYASQWLLHNCSNRLLTVRFSYKHSQTMTLEVGFAGYLPAGPSLALEQTVGRIMHEAEAITKGLGLWFPNLIEGDLVGSVLLRHDEPEAEAPLMAISDPEAFLEHWKEFLLKNPDADLNQALLPHKAVFWAGAYATAIEFGQNLEAANVANRPANDEEKRRREDSLLFSLQMRIRALKALGRYEEALTLFEVSAAMQPPESEDEIRLARASLYIRLRRFTDAVEVLAAPPETLGPACALSRALALLGVGLEFEAGVLLDAHEEAGGPDIAARALFRELQEERAKKPTEEPAAERLRPLPQDPDQNRSAH